MLLTLVSQVFAVAAIACVSVETMASVVAAGDATAMSHHNHVSDGNEPARKCCEESTCVAAHCFNSVTLVVDLPHFDISEMAGLSRSEYSLAYLNAELNALLRPPISR